MSPIPFFTATCGALFFSTGALLAQTKPTPDSTQSPRSSSVVVRQSGTGNSASITQSGGGGATTVVTSTKVGNTTTVRHDGPSSVQIDQADPADLPRTAPKPETGKPKPH